MKCSWYNSHLKITTIILIVCINIAIDLQNKLNIKCDGEFPWHKKFKLDKNQVKRCGSLAVIGVVEAHHIYGTAFGWRSPSLLQLSKCQSLLSFEELLAQAKVKAATFYTVVHWTKSSLLAPRNTDLKYCSPAFAPRPSTLVQPSNPSHTDLQHCCSAFKPFRHSKSVLTSLLFKSR